MRRSAFYLIIFGLLVGLTLAVYVQNKLQPSVKGSLLQIAKEEKEKKPAEIAEIPKPAAKDIEVKEIKGEFDLRNAFVKVADGVGRAVVAISTERTQRVGFPRSQIRFKRFGFGSPFDEEDPFEKFFEDFFGERFGEREFTQRGLGSGFIIDTEGHILTNHHVVDGAEKINITLPDGRTFAATLKGADPRSDLAIIKIDAKDLPTVELGDSNLLQIGEWVVALGNPFGHILKSPKPTVTVGVVSALHRRLPVPGGEWGYLDMIQTDAAINPGNSGGPLCDVNGKVMGINVVIFSTTGGYQGVGFAIPINEAKSVLDDLIKGHEITYGWLGVSVQEITPDIAKYFSLQDTNGALISQIVPDSPAEKAGLKEGDVMRSYKGKEIVTVHDLLREVGNTKAGEVVGIDIIRDKVKKRITAKIEKRPSKIEISEGMEFRAPLKVEEWRGLRVTDITDDIARELNLKNREGVVIIAIDPSGPGYGAGLRKGDVVREINKTRIKDVAGYKKIIQEVKGSVLVRTDRGYFIVGGNE